MNFNYQKAYCIQAVPAFNNLEHKVRDVHIKVHALIGDLQQDRTLAIPMTSTIRANLETLTTDELAELSRASYFCGHWHPSLLPRLFDSSKGESWKISNCCDQILRERLGNTHKIEIHGGELRVTFSSRDCWTWEEFGLATEKNLELFKSCGLPFGEETLHASANKLKELTGDLWGNVDDEPDNELYKQYLELAKEQERQTIISRFNDKIARLEQRKTAAQHEINFLLECNTLGVPVDNVIYYSHTGVFCFGWRQPLTEKEIITYKELLKPLLDDDYQSNFVIEFK